MRALWAAWPPGASRSITAVRRPSDAPYTAAARPAGPAPIDDEVVERRLGASSAARARRRARAAPAPCSTVAVGQQHQRQLVVGAAEQRVQALRLGVALELEPLVVHVVAGEEHPRVVAAFRPAVADDPHAVEAVGCSSRSQSVEQVVEDGIQPLLGRRPRLHQVVVEPDLVDRLDRHVGVGVGGEQHELGAGGERLRARRATRCRSSRACGGRTRSGRPAGRGGRAPPACSAPRRPTSPGRCR